MHAAKSHSHRRVLLVNTSNAVSRLKFPFVRTWYCHLLAVGRLSSPTNLPESGPPVTIDRSKIDERVRSRTQVESPSFGIACVWL
jgi:hypothetical protein